MVLASRDDEERAVIKELERFALLLLRMRQVRSLRSAPPLAPWASFGVAPYPGEGASGGGVLPVPDPPVHKETTPGSPGSIGGGGGSKSGGPDEWLELAQEHAVRRGFTFTTRALERMEDAFPLAADLIQAEPARREEATEALRGFVDRMVDYARIVGDDQLTVVGLNAATMKCGFWPWCYIWGDRT